MFHIDKLKASVIILFIAVIVLGFALSASACNTDESASESVVFGANKAVWKQLNQSPSGKIIKSIDKYAWPEGTEKEKWLYETGYFMNDDIIKLFYEVGYGNSDKDSNYTSCNHFVDVIVYDALGEHISIMPEDPYADWGPLPKNFKIVHEGSIGDFKLQPGDIIRYRKNKKEGYRSQHALIYYGNGLIAESGIRTRYPIIYSAYYGNNIIKWEREEVDRDTIQVIRIKAKK